MRSNISNKNPLNPTSNKSIGRIKEENFIKKNAKALGKIE